MNRPDFDNMTDKEMRQQQALINYSLGTELAQRQRKKLAEAITKIELGIDDEGEPE